MVTLLRLRVLRYFLNETMALRDSSTDGLEEGSVPLSTFHLGNRISTGGRRRGGDEPEPDEQSKRLRRDSQVMLKTFGLAGETIEASHERSLESIGRVRGEKRGDPDPSLHDLASKPETVGWIHSRLAGHR